MLGSYWPTTLGYRVWLRYLVLLSHRKLLFPSQWISIANNFLLKNGNLCTLPFFNLRILSVLNLCRSCACCKNLYEFICVSLMVCGRHICFGDIFSISHPLLHRTLSLEGRGLMKLFQLGSLVSYSLSVC